MLLSFFIGLLTVVLVLDCLFLLLLILIQLPKKEAGLGQAFGSSTTDALFGAGSGTALTKMTKYAAVIFFALTFFLAILNARQAHSKGVARGLREGLSKAKEPAAQTVTTNAAEATNLPPKAAPPAVPLSLTNLTVAPTNAAAVVTSKPPAAVTPAPPAPSPAAPATNPPAAPQPK
jgi:preprotein translocase subunit SecG